MRIENTLLIWVLALAMTPISEAFAQSKKAKSSAPPKAQPQQPQNNSDKVDISDLETKYWAPKDTDFSVVQNRTYTKEKRFAVSLMAGRLINDSYSEGSVYGLNGNYFFNERSGVQLSYIQADVDDNDSVSSLVSFGGGVRPDFGRLDSYWGVGYNWVPFYAKMSVLGKKILYFDMVFTPTLGYLSYDQVLSDGNQSEKALAYGFDVSQYFFFSNNFSLRLDLQNKWFKEDIAKSYNDNVNGISQGQNFRSKTTHTTLFMLGINFFF